MSVPPDRIDPKTINTIIGIDNMSPETALPAGFVRDAVNFDLPTAGKPRTRPGRTQLRECTFAHSGWGDGDWPWAVWVDDGDLVGIRALGDTPVTLVSGLSRTRPVSYARANDLLYWVNGQRAGILTVDGESIPWACEVPAGQPLLAPNTSAGGLFAGRYMVAVTYRDALGRESGTGEAALIEITEGQGITLSGIPQPVDPHVLQVRVYVSPANGDEMYHVRDLAVGITSTTIIAGARGKKLETQFQQPIPIGELVAFGHGRVWTLGPHGLCWGEALRGAQGKPDNYIRFPAPWSVLAPVGEGEGAAGAGVYVVGGKRTVWLSGPKPGDFGHRVVYQAGAVPGSLTWAPAAVWGFESELQVPCWLATDGQFVVGLPGGQVKSFNAQRVAADSGERGASVVRERNGLRQMLTAIHGPRASSLAVRDRVVATITRNDIPAP